jgi:hypothetical protein
MAHSQVWRLEHFWAKVNRRSITECWNWKGSFNDKGYGMFWNGEKRELAHRFIFKIYYDKSIPDNLWVLHTCGNRKCVNPIHLYLGDVRDNAVDRDTHLIQDMMGVSRELKF